MKKIIFIFILILSSKINYSQTGWFIQTPFTSKSVYCMEPTAIHNLYSGSDSGIVYQSTNNGYNWTVISQDTSVRRLPIRFMYGGNNDDFYAVGDSAAYISKVGNVVVSTRIVAPNIQTRSNLKAFSYLQGAFAYEVFETVGDSGVFYITPYNNPGQWRRDTAATRIVAGIRINSSSSFIFVGDNGLIMKADSIGILRPNGERIKWRIIQSGTTHHLYGVKVTSSGLCMIVGAGGTILKSTNFGDSWSTVACPVTEDLFFINFTYANLVCGANGTILKCIVNTYDNWFRQTTPTNQNLHSIQSLTYTDYIAMGDNGIILRTTDGGGPPAGIVPSGNTVPDGFSLLQNYPNPFNPISKVKFEIAKLSAVKLIVFDALGREVETLVNEQLKPGSYEVDFDGSRYPSGVYFYKLETDDYIETKKMILVK